MTRKDNTVTTNADWLDLFRFHLVSTGLDDKQAENAVNECAEHLRESGEQAQDAFGSPNRYAAQLGRTQVGEHERAAFGVDALKAGDEWVGLVTMAGVSLVVFAIFFGSDHGATTPLTGAGVAGAACLAGIFVLVGVALEARQAGRFGWFRLLVGLAVVGIVGAATAFTTLPGERIGSIPTWLIAVVGVAVSLASFKLATWTEHRHVVRETTSRGSAHDSSSAPAAGELDDAAWLRRLSGLLRGRHDWTAESTRQAVREAETHLVDTGQSAQQEYGPVQVYALRLAEDEPSRRGRFHRGVRAELLLGVLFTGGGVWGLVQGPGDWADYGSLAIGVVSLFDAWRQWKDAGTTSRDDTAPTSEAR